MTNVAPTKKRVEAQSNKENEVIHHLTRSTFGSTVRSRHSLGWLLSLLSNDNNLLNKAMFLLRSNPHSSYTHCVWCMGHTNRRAKHIPSYKNDMILSPKTRQMSKYFFIFVGSVQISADFVYVVERTIYPGHQKVEELLRPTNNRGITHSLTVPSVQPYTKALSLPE